MYGKKSVFLTLWLSYVLVLAIPVSIGAVLYTMMIGTLTDNANRSNLAMLEQVRQVTDEHLREIDRLTVLIATHPKIQQLWMNDGGGTDRALQYVEAIRAMNSILNSTNYVSNFYIHVDNEQTVVGPSLKADADIFFNQAYPLPGMNFEQVRGTLLTGYHYKSFFSLNASGERSGSTLLSTVSLPIGEKERPRGTLVMLLENEQISAMFKPIQQSGKGTVFLVDGSGEVLLSTSADKRLPDGLKEAVAAKSGNSSFHYKGEPHMLSFTTGQNDWKIVSLVPQSVVFQRVYEIKSWAIVLLALILVAGTAAAYGMAYRSYSPLRDMVLALRIGRPADDPSGSNEYEYIKTSITRTLLEGEESKRRLDSMMPVARAHFLTRLLKGQSTPADLEKDALQLIGLHVSQPYVYAVLIELEEDGGFQMKESERDRLLARFIVHNLAAELADGSGYVTEMDRSRFVLVMNTPSREEEGARQREQLIGTLKRYIEDRFHMKVWIATSSIRQGLEEAAACYQEAEHALDYRILHEAGTVIHYEQLERREQSFYFYPLELEAKLINHMKCGDAEQAVSILDQLYERNMTSRRLTPELGKFLFFDMLSTILKVMHALQIGDRLWLDGLEINPVKLIADSHSAEGMLHNIKELCEQICRHVREAPGSQAQLRTRLQQYIEEHYSDHSFSLNAMADHFEMTPPYISSMFKKQHGINLTDYIANLRIARAKAYLTESNLTIQQIAEKVGYTTDIGFIRVFKKLEGVTPGKYRELSQPAANS
ncbi:helix-turn-helix domain-containing protein [Paenibacillus thalictri]|uniref:AraC family transcriptional regulator n=1 Tax=Paenibacillus thalictri TaxID=2527873 RepID=A0A4Q9DS16_9BACL|nr:helix-turn-helix domain-containing protein [Paenibacillus thalictri]TBL78534.1 AraC family transcriptional regulator [Paenibacillus thalictri]